MTFDNDGAGTACDTASDCRETMSDGAIIANDSTGRVQYRMKPGQSFSEAVIEAVAACSDRTSGAAGRSERDLTALDPLYDAIEPDALDALFAPIGDEARSDGTVTFTYSDHRVTVESEGFVTVVPQ